MTGSSFLRSWAGLLVACSVLGAAQLQVRISVGHQSPLIQPFYIRLSATSAADSISQLHVEPGSGQVASAGDNIWIGQAGGGRVSSAVFNLSYTDEEAGQMRPMHVMWADLLNHSDPDTVRRLSRDAGSQSKEGTVKLLFGREKASGLSFTAAQLQQERAMWVPSYDLFITLAGETTPFEAYDRSRKAQGTDTVLERTSKEGEASYDDYLSKWADMGDPSYIHPHQPQPGHIICLSWDSAIPKFGVDRGSGVWNDYGNPDHFRFWFSFGDLTQGIIKTWKGQRLAEGLPIVTTTLEKEGVRYEVEQFAYPLAGPPSVRKGDISMVLLQKVRMTNLRDIDRVIPVSMTHRRSIPIQTGASIEAEARPGEWLFVERARKRALLSVQGIDSPPEWHETVDYDSEDKRVGRSVRFDLTVSETLKAGQSKEFIVKLPSPIVEADATDLFAKLDYVAAREATRRFWSDWVSRGAQFQVPEQAVNDLFRASLWHALRLPRRHGAEGAAIDLPYSNFAYDQTGIPWPGVHSIYVDYMLYELRGYFPVALEELMNEFRLNQDANGHVSGFANWMMYTPSMLYASGQYYLMSHDRAGFERLLPYALKALTWCEEEYARARSRGDLRGLVEGPLNDGTGEGIWALNQAYLYAGMERFGRALAEFGDPHSGPALAQAQQLRSAIQDGFTEAASSAPLVQLRDHSWQPFIPSDARTPRRLMDVWYPSDVDTGPLHLVRLKALPADGKLSEFMLNDHEDNLFLNGLGMANEPVYEPQALAYLYRDDQKAAIRAFYSQLACAFSHSVFEPVEHRWMHGQYFGPPSTDGAWFELYRNMLVREMDDDTLIIGQATPRNWLEDGKAIRGSHAPTYFGEVSFDIESHTDRGRISAIVDLSQKTAPTTLLLRLRHPNQKPIKAISVNGKPWQDFDSSKEWVRIEKPQAAHYEIVASY